MEPPARVSLAVLDKYFVGAAVIRLPNQLTEFIVNVLGRMVLAEPVLFSTEERLFSQAARLFLADPDSTRNVFTFLVKRAQFEQLEPTPVFVIAANAADVNPAYVTRDMVATHITTSADAGHFLAAVCRRPVLLRRSIVLMADLPAGLLYDALVSTLENKDCSALDSIHAVLSAERALPERLQKRRFMHQMLLRAALRRVDVTILTQITFPSTHDAPVSFKRDLREFFRKATIDQMFAVKPLVNRLIAEQWPTMRSDANAKELFLEEGLVAWFVVFYLNQDVQEVHRAHVIRLAVMQYAYSMNRRPPLLFQDRGECVPIPYTVTTRFSAQQMRVYYEWTLLTPTAPLPHQLTVLFLFNAPVTAKATKQSPHAYQLDNPAFTTHPDRDETVFRFVLDESIPLIQLPPQLEQCMRVRYG